MGSMVVRIFAIGMMMMVTREGEGLKYSDDDERMLVMILAEQNVFDEENARGST